MPTIDLVFVVLTYREVKDLIELIESIKEKVNVKYKIIVVNSYYDELSRLAIKEIAEGHNCDFINVPNNGYGAGNNKGIEFANEKYKYNFLIICNPDTEIIKFDYDDIKGKENYIIAPEIITPNGSKQNPFRLINSRFLDTIKYYAFKHKRYKFIYIDIIANKLVKSFNKIAVNALRRQHYPIYSCHGSFIIIGKKAVNLIGKLYNEKMFLFAEEDHLAMAAFNKKVVTIMNHNIQILHKEDGSVRLLNGKIMDFIGDSFVEYYKYWYRDKPRQR